MDIFAAWIPVLQIELDACARQPDVITPSTILLLHEFFEEFQCSYKRLHRLTLANVQQLQGFVGQVWLFLSSYKAVDAALVQQVYDSAVVLVRWNRVALRKDKRVFWLDRFSRTLAAWIRPQAMAKVESQMNRLMWVAQHDKDFSTVKPNSSLGNVVVDFFTYGERLKTRGKYNVSFVEFLARKEEFLQKRFIQTMLHHHATQRNKRRRKSWVTLYADVYSICISAINIMKPINCMRFFVQFGAKRVLNCCCGWGGSLVAAAALQLEAYYGIDINRSLQLPYENLLHYLRLKSPSTHMTCLLGVDASVFDYAAAGWSYDTVFCSPPYFFLEKYEHNISYGSRQEMVDKLYWPLFRRAYDHLLPGGWFLINVCPQVVEKVLEPMLGRPQLQVPLHKAFRQNRHQEVVYCWRKDLVHPS